MRVVVTLAAAAAFLLACEGPPPVAEGEGEEGEGEEGEGEGEGEEGEGEEGEGEPAPFCPQEITDAILACVPDVVDPESNFFVVDAMLACADAEPVAGHFDDYCAENADENAACADFGAFLGEQLPDCVANVQRALFDGDGCVFPSSFNNLVTAHGLATVERRTVSNAGELDEAQRSALLLVDNFADVDAAFAGGPWQLLRVRAYGTNREITFFSRADVDTQIGAGFFSGTTFRVATIVDDGVFDCLVEPGVEGSVCSDAVPCAAGVCGGVFEGNGACDVDDSAQTGFLCSSDDDCEGGTVCRADGPNVDGVCELGLSRGGFRALPKPLLEVTDIEIDVFGLLTVATRARVDVRVTQPNPDNVLTVSLLNPSGTVLAVGELTGFNASFTDQDAIGLPGDESANGTWILRVEGGAAGGDVVDAFITVDSRFD